MTDSTSTTVPSDSDLGLGDLFRLIRIVWPYAFVGAALGGAAAIALSFLVTPSYRVDVLLEYVGDPTKQERVGGGGGAGIGGLAALVGINVGSEGNPKDAALAVLRSWEFSTEFIRNNDLMPVLNAEDWNAELDTWNEDPPSEWFTVKRFLRDNLYVSEDAKTGLVTLSVDWTEPELAASWASKLVAAANERLRVVSEKETSRSIEHLEAKLEETQNTELQRVLAALLQAQIESLMFADIREEFAFRTLDPAVAPPLEEYDFPNRLLFAAVGIFLGGLLAAPLGLLFYQRRSRSRVASA
ncbi:MAG: hypothetical protein AAGC71_02970 [Pseudomonadota bacterium]